MPYFLALISATALCLTYLIKVLLTQWSHYLKHYNFLLLFGQVSYLTQTHQVLLSCIHHMKALHHIRHCLYDQTASLYAYALISSCFDYANSVLLVSPNYANNKLQHIQNSLPDCLAQLESLL